MSDYHIYLKMPSYLRQWFVHRHSGSEPVRLHNRCIELKLIKLALVPQPEFSFPHRQQENEVAICIPYSKQRDLTPKTFQTSILCQKIGISHDGFYSSMQEYHKYDASDFSYLDSLGYEKIIKEAQQERYSIRSLSNFSSLDTSLDCRTDADIDPMQPLSIGMDYNANINWIVCGQPRGNRQNNDDLILAIQSAGVERGRNGFRKNKSMEKQPESEEDLLEHRTDGTDAFDTIYIGCEKFPQHDFYPISVGGVR